jgi:hypothetical protein
MIVLYYLAFPNVRWYMKYLVYGVYVIEVVQSALITETGFRTFVTGLGDVQVFGQAETGWLSVPILTAISELSRTEHEGLTSNIPLRYILCPGILCVSDQNFGTIEENRGGNYCCKLSKEVKDVNTVNILHGTQLSFIQLGGGIAFGVSLERKKYYTLLRDGELIAFERSTIGVWTTTQVCSQLSNDITCRSGMLGVSSAISLLPCP